MHRTLALLLVLFVVGASAQEVTLRYTFKKGETIRTKESMTQTVSSEAMPGGGQVVKSTRYTSLKVNGIGADGTADVVRSTDSSTMLLNDKPFTNPQATMAEKIAFKIKIDRSGKIIEAAPVEAPTDPMGKQMTDGMASGFKNAPGLPGKPVKVGDTWDDEMTTNQPTQSGMLTIHMKMKTKLEKLSTQDGIDVAILQVTGTLSGELGAGMGTISGTISGSRNFAYKAGYELGSTLNTDQTMDITTPQGNMMMTTKMKQVKERMK
jgi:hypothetical protein